MARIRFRLGPFSTSQRIGRTRAQKRAAAKTGPPGSKNGIAAAPS